MPLGDRRRPHSLGALDARFGIGPVHHEWNASVSHSAPPLWITDRVPAALGTQDAMLLQCGRASRRSDPDASEIDLEVREDRGAHGCVSFVALD